MPNPTTQEAIDLMRTAADFAEMDGRCFIPQKLREMADRMEREAAA